MHLSDSQLRIILLRLGIISDDSFKLKVPVAHIESPYGANFMIEKIAGLDVETALTILRDTIASHRGDVNFLHEDYRLLERLVRQVPTDYGDDHINNPQEAEKIQEDLEEKIDYSTFKNKTYLNIIDWELQVRLEAALIEFHSPYPEIRSITDPFDDPTIPVDTLRAYAIGLFWTVIGSIVNNFFVHRMPSISLSSHTIQLLLLPSGRLWEKSFVYNKQVHVLGRVVNLNPGPWNCKEMMLSSIIYSCSSGTPYAIYNIFVMKLDKFYGLKWVTLTFQLLLVLSTQFLGFGFAGIMRKICIYPAKALWPTVLPLIALNRALVDQEESKQSIYGWSISRYSFFFVVFIVSFFYNWLPSFFFKALSTFNWPTWFRPDSLHLANITGSNIGLGLNPLPTLDWNVLNAAGCLTIPFYTYLNQYIGTVLAFFVILTIYYTNNKWTGYLPINTNELFNNKGEVYKVHEILNDKNHFDKGKYSEIGPPYFSAANLVVYGAYFALYPFAIIYHVVSEWDSMKTSFKNVANTMYESFSFKSKSVYGSFIKDPHCRMMSKYDEVPDWWFMAILVISTLFGILCVLVYPTETPVWGILFTIAINFVFLIPITAIASVTGFSFGLNVLVELIVGYAIPNSGLALITLKSYGTNIDHQAANYITDQKVAHYAKIPPRAIFKGQMISTVVSIAISLAIANWQLGNVEDLCERHQKNKLSCPGANTYFYSSIQYGVIGPAKVFSGVYPVLKWCFLLGVVLVIPCILFKHYGPRKLTRYFNPTVVIGGFLLYAPFNLSYYTGGFYLSYIFMYYIKKNYILWWEKYNYILTSALSAGVAFSTLLIFFTVRYDSIEINWWGNTISDMGIEGDKLPLNWLDISTAPDGYFGLRKDQFP
ncbi:oligopeptide transporter protein [Yamadazyma tenuis ATCC 10573]|uniref:Oligopeptide transporter protein n=2 Tax=Candida tenuis TaxID=2315449 RepID=G3AZG3_CANTC|nr:oligopeptide transporter protein [Yamadazyma tenuis ATCC 10573]EGV66088.1 oligopeptide transporter protein [Yamadazyma tenuis ATCC 10573]